MDRRISFHREPLSIAVAVRVKIRDGDAEALRIRDAVASVSPRTAECNATRDTRVVSCDPIRILVQLCAAKARIDGVEPEVVRRHVELVVRRAYPRVEVMVLWRKDVPGARVHVVGDDPSARHTDVVRRLVDFVLTKAARLASDPEPRPLTRSGRAALR